MRCLDATGFAEVCLQEPLRGRPRGKEILISVLVIRTTQEMQLDAAARFPQRLFHFFSLLGRYGRVGIPLDQKHRRFYPAGHGNWRNTLGVGPALFWTPFIPGRLTWTKTLPWRLLVPLFEVISVSAPEKRPFSAS